MHKDNEIMDLRTEREKMLDERNEKIKSLYYEQREANPGVSDTRICSALAQQFYLTTDGVRYILKQQGVL